MSQSPITVSYSLEEVLSRIEGKIDGLVKDVTDLKVGQAEIRGDFKALDEKLSGQISAIDSRLNKVETSMQKIPDLAERVGELKNWRQIAVIGFTAFISGVVTWFIRGGNLKP